MAARLIARAARRRRGPAPEARRGTSGPGADQADGQGRDDEDRVTFPTLGGGRRSPRPAIGRGDSLFVERAEVGIGHPDRHEGPPSRQGQGSQRGIGPEGPDDLPLVLERTGVDRLPVRRSGSGAPARRRRRPPCGRSRRGRRAGGGGSTRTGRDPRRRRGQRDHAAPRACLVVEGVDRRVEAGPEVRAAGLDGAGPEAIDPPRPPRPGLRSTGNGSGLDPRRRPRPPGPPGSRPRASINPFAASAAAPSRSGTTSSAPMLRLTSIIRTTSRPGGGSPPIVPQRGSARATTSGRHHHDPGDPAVSRGLAVLAEGSPVALATSGGERRQGGHQWHREQQPEPFGSGEHRRDASPPSAIKR